VLQQQSRAQWLQKEMLILNFFMQLCLAREGDVNSKFFHAIMSGRQRGNAVSSFVVNGMCVEVVDNVRSAVFSHFSSHYKSQREGRSNMDALHFPCLSYRDDISLVKPFSVEEVKAAVWDCDNFKCPGPHGVTFGFIKDFWNILCDDVIRYLVKFHRNGRLTKGINSMFIALIPKVDSPQQLNEFRPISLVGSLYKILAKVLANRLRLVIGSVVSDT